MRSAYDETWSRPSRPTTKYCESGCEKYQPLTDAPGHMAIESVSSMPVFFSTSSSSQSVAFSVCSGHAG